MLHSVGLGITNFDGVYRQLPEPVHCDEQGKPLSSWRFRVLPYIEAIMREFDYEAPWDDPANDWLTSTPYSIYCFSYLTGSDSSPLHTSVVLITGPGTAFDGEHTYSLEDIDSDQIIAIEVADSGVHWAAPGDISLDDISPEVLQGLDGEGLHVLFADAAVAFVPYDASFQNLKKFFTVRGAKENDREEFIGTLFTELKQQTSPW